MSTWQLLLCLVATRFARIHGAIDANIYEKLFMVNWPMFEKMTEKVVQVHAKDVLDLGTGPGQPSLLIAKTLPSAKVHATDLQEAMVEKAKKRAEGVKNLDFSVHSADDLSSFHSKSFDAVTMSFVLMFVPDKAKSLREIGRVLRAGGHAFISIWKKMPFFTLAVEAYAEIAGEKPKEMPVNPLALAEEKLMKDLIEETRGLLVLEHEEPGEDDLDQVAAQAALQLVPFPNPVVARQLLTLGEEERQAVLTFFPAPRREEVQILLDQAPDPNAPASARAAYARYQAPEPLPLEPGATVAAPFERYKFKLISVSNSGSQITLDS
ncbi:unnamed protein product [Durusdinium trenchii]|uniref:Methyltransferase type 11 domain-containing protein n=1 Tax=Durusdinium trenchii TaxID=1381693 RepID=A0ABP0SC00_9DINO